MELVEPIEKINRKLRDNYGLAPTGQPNFRIVFSDDQFEKRWTDYTDEGFHLLNPEVRELPKYRHYIQQKYILERLLPVPPDSDLVEQVSYEPVYAFMDKNQNYLPPRYDMAKFYIDVLLAAGDRKNKGIPKYQDPAVDPEFRRKEILSMQNLLFGNETELGDALAHGWGESFAGLDGRPNKGEDNA